MIDKENNVETFDENQSNDINEYEDAQSLIEQEQVQNEGNMSSETAPGFPEDEYESENFGDAENSLNDGGDAKKDEEKPDNSNRGDIKDLENQIAEQQKTIKSLTTAIEDMNLQIKDLISKEKVRQEIIKKFLDDIANGCTELKKITDRFVLLNNNIVDDTTEQLDIYFGQNFKRLTDLGNKAGERCERIVKQVIEIGVKNINASVLEQKKFIKGQTLKFSFASWALTITGLFTPLFILYLIAMLKRWI